MILPTSRNQRTFQGASQQSGNALLTALILLTVATSGAAAFLGVAVHASEGATNRTDRFETSRAGRTVNKLAAESIWNGYRRNLGGTDASVNNLRSYLTARGYAHQAGAMPARVDVMGLLGLPTDKDGNTIFGDCEIDSVMVHRVDQGRDTRLVITTSIRARRGVLGQNGDVATAETDLFAIEPARWDGLDYALLANNINCIMCHTEVDDARRVYEGSLVADAGDYQRARVGSIESFQLRDDPDSTIAGTLYLGGPAVDEHGDPITNWTGLNLNGAELDSNGRLIESRSGDIIQKDLVPADLTNPQPFENLYVDYLSLTDPVDGTLPETFPLPFRDDGGVDPVTGDPTASFADNRVVDDNEFGATTASYTGAISGGVVSVIAPGSRVASASDVADFESGNASLLGAVTSGNVLLKGTDQDPIQISGDVAIDGDLIISGPIEGTGSLWVRGNIYVRGDLEYADATTLLDRQFGVSERGVANALAMASGGNVIIGDPYRPQWGEGGSVDGTPGGGWNFTLEQLAIFNRGEWLKTQPTLPGLPETVQTGVNTVQRERFQNVDRVESQPITERRDTGRTQEVPVYTNVQTGTREEPVYTTVTIPATRPAPYGSPTTERRQTGTREVPVYERQQTGTRWEPIYEDVVIGYQDVTVTDSVPFDPPVYDSVDEPIFEVIRPDYPNPSYKGATFIPRYYAMGPGDAVPVHNVEGYFNPANQMWVTEERVEGWDPAKLTLADPSDPSDPTLYPAGSPNAVVTTLEPGADWIDPDLLKGMIEDTLLSRDADEALTVDGTMYSANSIFGLVPDSTSEGTNGELRVEGSVLGADVGLLGPKGTEILYDPRSQSVLDIRDETNLVLTLTGAVPAPRPGIRP